MNLKEADESPAMDAGRRSPRKSFSQQVSAIGARLTSLREGRDNNPSETETLVDKPDTPERSVSRGREAFQSTGRGGVGNIRPSSRDTRSIDSRDDLSSRGREPGVHPDRVFSVGRGGAGNIRSPSREPVISEVASEADYQARLVREHADASPVHSSGRGGAGNMTGMPRSRSRGPVPVMHSTGRGGAGNLYAGAVLKPEAMDEEERRHHVHHDAIHSTGRGGAANITSAHEPAIERVAHHFGEFESTGRGGAGNIRTRSGSRDPGSRAGSKEKHGLAAVLDKLTHPHQQPRTSGTPPGASDVGR